LSDWRSQRRGRAVNTRSPKPSERSDDRNRSAWLYLGPRSREPPGPRAFPGKEHEARRGLISEEERLKFKDLVPARGGGAPGSAPTLKIIAAPVATAPHRTGDPSSSSYQAEYRARKRYENACYRIRALLEAGGLEAAILDPFNGILHRASTALWHDADRMIEKGRAPIPHSLNTGSFVVKKFPVQSTPRRPLPRQKSGT
jgi:hypothetical protein